MIPRVESARGKARYAKRRKALVLGQLAVDRNAPAIGAKSLDRAAAEVSACRTGVQHNSTAQTLKNENGLVGNVRKNISTRL